MNLKDKIVHAWNAFISDDQYNYNPDIGTGYTAKPDRVLLSGTKEKSFVAAIYNRIGIDASALALRHVRVDQNGRYLETISSGLNECLSVEANIDQSGRDFIRDAVMSMCGEGAVAIVPVDTTTTPRLGSYDIRTMRVGRVKEWFPTDVLVDLYNDRTGLRQDIYLPKRNVAIIENPLYSVMNEPNSILQRLIVKLSLLDAIDKASNSGKLDVIIKLPYVIKTETKQLQAEKRRKAIEDQLVNSPYGIAYIDGTEDITQLNRPVENNLMTQIEYLTRMLYSQLGLTQEVFDGNANESIMLNYHNRTIDPILSALADGMKRVFLTKTARSQGQSIMYFVNPFRLTGSTTLADMADKFTRNEILSSNEFRAILGFYPSKDPKADELRNKNINSPDDKPAPNEPQKELSDDSEE